MKSLGAESAALLREVDGCCARLRAGRAPEDVALVEAIAAELRRLVRETTRSSAADRARVRAAVNYFTSRAFSTALAAPRRRPALRVLPGGRAGAGPARRGTFTVEAAVVTEILGELTPGGRPASGR